MGGIRLKAVLLIVLVCVLVVMLMAIANPGVLSASIGTAPSGSSANRKTGGPAATAAGPHATAAATAATASTDAGIIALPAESPKSIYFSDVETVYISPEKDCWSYTSPALHVSIQKTAITSPVPLVYYIAEVRTKDPGLFFTCTAGDDTSGGVRMFPAQIAAKRKAVLAVASDFGLSAYQKGIVIRNGDLLCCKDRADTLAILPDGAFKIFAPRQVTPAVLISMNVKNTFSFGPTLIRDHVKNAAIVKSKQRAARTGVGMVEPGHYFFIVVDGGDSKYSAGATLAELMNLFRSRKCSEAYNLDGGAFASMCFMGEQLNGQPGKTSGIRKVPDLLAVGTSELVVSK